MAKVKKQQGKNSDELKAQVADIRKELQKLSQEKAKGQLKQTSLLRTKKDEIARLLTQMSMMKFVKPVEKSETKKEDVK